MQVNHLNFDESTAASHSVIAADSSKRYKLLLCFLMPASDVTITIEDSDGNNLIGPVDVSATNGFVLPDSGDVGWAHPAAGAGINVLLSDAVQTGGVLVIREDP